MRFDIITIFPKIFDSYFGESILGRAQKNKLIEIAAHDLRQWAADQHKTVDDSPYGGGPGMVLKIEPIWKAVKFLKSKIKNQKSNLTHPPPAPSPPAGRAGLRRAGPPDTLGLSLRAGTPLFKKEREKARIILFGAKGKQFTQADVRRLAKYDQLVLICGRYEGVDERVAEYIADEELSVGNFVLTGGEIPAMIVADTVSRLIPGVLGKKESLAEESFSKRLPTANCRLRPKQNSEVLDRSSSPADTYLEYPQYTRPENFRGWKVPKVLLSGDHKRIKEWREKMSN